MKIKSQGRYRAVSFFAFTLFSCLGSSLFINAASAEEAPVVEKVLAEKGSIYNSTAVGIDGKEIALSGFTGKVSLVVNTASNCGFTGQYAGLESIYQRYKDRGFVVLAFPSNDFGAQEPGTNEEIAHFCESTYNTSFPIFSKDHVKGENKQAVYQVLTKESPEEFQGDPGWNFVKFLVDKKGFVRARYSSATKPESNTITEEIEKLLNE